MDTQDNARVARELGQRLLDAYVRSGIDALIIHRIRDLKSKGHIELAKTLEESSISIEIKVFPGG